MFSSVQPKHTTLNSIPIVMLLPRMMEPEPDEVENPRVIRTLTGINCGQGAEDSQVLNLGLWLRSLRCKGTATIQNEKPSSAKLLFARF